MDWSFSAAPDCMASQIYKTTGNKKNCSHSILHQYNQETYFDVYSGTCKFMCASEYDVFYLLGLFLQQSLFIDGLKGI